MSSGREQQDGTSTDDHYTAIWGPERPTMSAGAVWNELSDILHGRGGLIEAARWDSAQLADPAMISSGEHLAEIALTAVQLSLRQVLLCIATLAEDAGYPPGYVNLLRVFPITLPSEIDIRNAP